MHGILICLVLIYVVLMFTALMYNVVIGFLFHDENSMTYNSMIHSSVVKGVCHV